MDQAGDLSVDEVIALIPDAAENDWRLRSNLASLFRLFEAEARPRWSGAAEEFRRAAREAEFDYLDEAIARALATPNLPRVREAAAELVARARRETAALLRAAAAPPPSVDAAAPRAPQPAPDPRLGHRFAGEDLAESDLPRWVRPGTLVRIKSTPDNRRLGIALTAGEGRIYAGAEGEIEIGTDGLGGWLPQVRFSAPVEGVLAVRWRYDLQQLKKVMTAEERTAAAADQRLRDAAAEQERLRRGRERRAHERDEAEQELTAAARDRGRAKAAAAGSADETATAIARAGADAWREQLEGAGDRSDRYNDVLAGFAAILASRDFGTRHAHLLVGLREQPSPIFWALARTGPIHRVLGSANLYTQTAAEIARQLAAELRAWAGTPPTLKGVARGARGSSDRLTPSALVGNLADIRRVVATARPNKGVKPGSAEYVTWAHRLKRAVLASVEEAAARGLEAARAATLHDLDAVQGVSRALHALERDIREHQLDFALWSTIAEVTGVHEEGAPAAEAHQRWMDAAQRAADTLSTEVAAALAEVDRLDPEAVAKEAVMADAELRAFVAGSEPPSPPPRSAPSPSMPPMPPVPPTDPSLFTVRPKFGCAGGPDEVVLTDKGAELAFAVGARLQQGPASAALLELHHGSGYLLKSRDGARLYATPLLERFNMLIWGALQERGYAERFKDRRGEGFSLTAEGRDAVRRGFAEQERLLDRCRRAHAAAAAPVVDSAPPVDTASPCGVLEQGAAAPGAKAAGTPSGSRAATGRREALLAALAAAVPSTSASASAAEGDARAARHARLQRFAQGRR